MKYLHPTLLCVLLAAVTWAILAHSDCLLWLVAATLLEGIACLYYYERRKSYPASFFSLILPIRYAIITKVSRLRPQIQLTKGAVR